MNLYNDIDPQCCKWLEELVTAGLIPKGDVLCADLATIDPDSVRHYTQRHWCCGIGGWPYTLKLAGWPADRPIDTASLPCQPFSVAGKQKGFDDERHIWPAFRQLVAKLRPTILIGEQVPAAIRLGWLDGVFDDLEKYGYACGALVLPACSVGAPHIRSRLFWCGVGNADGERRIGKRLLLRAKKDRRNESEILQVAGASENGFWSNSVAIPCADGKWRRVPGGVADAAMLRRQPEQSKRPENLQSALERQTEQRKQPCDNSAALRGTSWSNSVAIPCADGKWRRVLGGVAESKDKRRNELEYSIGKGLRREDKEDGVSFKHRRSGSNDRERTDQQPEAEPSILSLVDGLHEKLGDSRYQSMVEALNCFPLAGDVPGRTMLLKGAGNAIIPVLGAVFVKCVMEEI